MPTKSNPLGPAGARVAARIGALREQLDLTKTALSNRLRTLGRPMSLDVLTKIERGQRPVDADDLVAIASALGVSVVDLFGVPACAQCAGEPPAGFTCNHCGRRSGEAG